MPLVVPGVTNTEANTEADNKQEEWSNKLVGKKITDDEASTSDEVSFAKRDLPESHRVIPPNTMVTKDYNPNRLNVYVTEDRTVTHVQWA